MDVPKGVPIKPPRVLFISLWRLLIFGIIKTSHYFKQWSLGSNFVKDRFCCKTYLEENALPKRPSKHPR
jgi:hypothetical protein